MRIYNFASRHPVIPGPWENEPDKAQWIDPVTGLDCLIVRNHWGSLCGYVGVPPGHRWHGQGYDVPDVYVHGGLTYADYCQEGAEDGPGICHIPPAGHPENVWWLGFDTAHYMDLSPSMEIAYGETLKTLEDLEALMLRESMSPYGKTYKNMTYVRDEVASLAMQVQAVAPKELTR